MEAWDCDLTGLPTDATRHRWTLLGESGAKLLWCESAAVRLDGRSSPEQLLASDHTVDGLTELRSLAVSSHEATYGDTSELVVGLQLTHSGRFSRPAPDGVPRPMSVRHHPFLDETVGPPPSAELVSDDELYEIIDAYIAAAEVADAAGFDFVDVKACHGYLSHELLGAYDRPGQFGGSLENRTRLLRTVVAGVRRRVPTLGVVVRLSAFDTVTYVAGPDGVGRPIADGPYRYGFGTDELGHEIDLDEPIALLRMLSDIGVELVSITGSSPYSARHVQRPALRVGPDEYGAPEDPLHGVARHLTVTESLKRAVPDLVYVGSAYSYLQQWLPNVAQAALRADMTDLVGIARMHHEYPRFPGDVLAGRPLRTELMWAANL